MSSTIKKLTIGLVSTAIFSSFLALAMQGNFAQAATSTDVQLVCDQETVGVGETVTYHLIYHNVQNKSQSNVWLKIKVPAVLNIDSQNMNGAEWDATTRILQWNLKDIETNGARVIHFNLKVQATVALNTIFEVSCIAEEEGQAAVETPKLKVRTGSQVDQPFFIGYPDGKFHPNSSITRAEVAAIVSRVKNLENGSRLAVPYTDVSSEHWANTYISKVTHEGYMKGYGDGTFHPDQPISRAELVTLMLHLRGVHAVPLVGFDDTNGFWAQDIVGTAKELKFIDGVGDGQFDPNGHTERQAAAKLFDVGIFRGPLVDGDIPVVQHFPDVLPNQWSFGWVEEASVVAHESVHKGRGLEYLIRYLPDQTEPF